MAKNWIINKDGVNLNAIKLSGHDFYQCKFIDEPIATFDMNKLDSLSLGGILCIEEGYIICGCCGAIIDLEDVTALYIYDEWIDINSAIKGE